MQAYKYWGGYSPSGSYGYDLEVTYKKLLLIDPVKLLSSVIAIKINMSQRKTQVCATFHI